MTAAAPDPAAPLLRLHGLRIDAGDRPLLSGLDLVVSAGEFVAVIGPNGAGKTRLFRAILGLEPPAAGRIELLGQPVRRGHRRVGYVPQQRIIPRGTPLTARDLVMLGRTGRRFGLPLTTRADRESVARAIRAVDGESLARRPVGDLSGGEQQRFRIAQALVDDPALLLLDEPLSSLDTEHRRQMVEVVQAQQARGAGILFITHDLDPVSAAADRVLVLRGDGDTWIGHPRDIQWRDLQDRAHHPEASA